MGSIQTLRAGIVLALVSIGILGSSGLAARAGDTPRTHYLGVDLSYVNEMEDCGGEYRVNGELRDPFEIFHDYGANLVRVRLWHTPDWTEYSTLEDVKKTISRAKALGMSVLLDFHYSDTWADPSKQIIPAAWATITDVDELAQALYDYTYSTLIELDEEGLMPDLVQVGNETNSEILRGENEPGYPINWERNATLFNAAIQAVRDAGTVATINPKVVVHIAQPENVEGWLLSAERAGVTDFDIVGISYYPGWSDNSITGVGNLVTKFRLRFSKDILIAEMAYPWTFDSENETAGNIVGRDYLEDGYPATPAGQKQFLVDLTQAVLANGGLGVVYWEPAWISTSCRTLWGQGSHWENATFFDFHNQNNVLEGIEFLSYPYELPVEIEFQVTLEDGAAADGAYFWGDFAGTGRRLLPMQQVDENTFVLSTPLMTGQTIMYGFYNGSNRRDNHELLDSACAVGEEGLRTLDIPDVDSQIAHEFGQCEVSIRAIE